MLEKIKRALLLSDVPSFSENYKSLADDVEVELTVEQEWNVKYRVTSDVVICGSKYLESVNHVYYSEVVLILKEGENPASYIKEGITRFIFNYKNNYELLCAFYKPEKIVLHSSSNDLRLLIKDCNILNFQAGDYDFKFDKNRFSYKGRAIYLSDSAKQYLAEWLLNSNKDNRKRMILCSLRKKLGKDFLKDVDRFGQLRESKDE